MKGSLGAIWRWVRWPVYILAGAYVVLVIYRTFVLMDADKTAEAVAAIHAQKITLADVQGANLPPVPDQAENDSTVAGIDKNNNGIRDDVELAIFKKYPNDKKSRAAALQYAMTEQMYLTSVTNTETWKAVAEEVGRAGLCLLDTRVKWDETDKLIFNNKLRTDAQEKAYEFITSYGPASGIPCDVLPE
ncbi:hypothetical protein EXS62_00645 [Candidatus Kaiserbacteria bacterium]|nr:hypothetical protein [Candidatus Kaiserbacteria bacterium]